MLRPEAYDLIIAICMEASKREPEKYPIWASMNPECWESEQKSQTASDDKPAQEGTR